MFVCGGICLHMKRGNCQAHISLASAMTRLEHVGKDTDEDIKGANAK